MWVAQDKDGYIYKYEQQPKINFTECEWFARGHYELVDRKTDELINWHNSLINLNTHDYKIEDGILVKVKKTPIHKPVPRKHAELACRYFSDDTVCVQYQTTGGYWIDDKDPIFYSGCEYREKPKTKTVRFRNYKNYDDEICVTIKLLPHDFKEWIGDWQEVTVDE